MELIRISVAFGHAGVGVDTVDKLLVLGVEAFDSVEIDIAQIASYTPVFVEEVGHVEEVEREVELLCLVDFDALAQVEVKDTIEAIDAPVALGDLAEAVADIWTALMPSLRYCGVELLLGS